LVFLCNFLLMFSFSYFLRFVYVYFNIFKNILFSSLQIVSLHHNGRYEGKQRKLIKLLWYIYMVGVNQRMEGKLAMHSRTEVLSFSYLHILLIYPLLFFTSCSFFLFFSYYYSLLISFLLIIISLHFKLCVLLQTCMLIIYT
jgi:hypothetical protein